MAAVRYVLIVCTNVEVVLLGVCFAGDDTNHQVSHFAYEYLCMCGGRRTRSCCVTHMDVVQMVTVACVLIACTNVDDDASG
jgi:hypothetical protein